MANNNAENTQFSHDSRLIKLADGADFPTTIGGTIDGEDLGWFHTDGETLSVGKTVNRIKAHQGDTTVRTSITDSEVTLAVTALENKKLVRELYHGGTEAPDGTLTVNGSTAIRAKFVYQTFDTQEGFLKAEQYNITATVTPNGERVFVYGELSTFPLLFTVEGFYTVISENIDGS